jgi:hypothetical protein
MNVLAWLSAFSAGLSFAKEFFKYLNARQETHKEAVGKMREMKTALKKGDINEVQKLFKDTGLFSDTNDSVPMSDKTNAP